MFIKTSSIIAREYLEIIHLPNFSNDIYNLNLELIFRTDTDYLIQFNEDIYVENIDGLTTIVLREHETQTLKHFVIQNLVKVRKGLFFSFIANSYNPIIKTYIPKKAQFAITKLSPKVNSKRIISNFNISEIYTIFYLSKNDDYTSPNNFHNYYELTFIDNGSIEVTVEDQPKFLNKNDLLIITPFQKHSFIAKSKVTLISIMFLLDGVVDAHVIARPRRCNERMIELMHYIYQASDCQNQHNTELLVSYLKEIIICLQFFEDLPTHISMNTLPKQLYEDETFNEIINYIQNNLYTTIDIEEICGKFGMSRTSLQNLFKINLNTTPKYYINEEKLKISKKLLLQKRKTISEIADELGYSSVHYFSRKFKQRFQQTPSEFANTPK